MDVGEKDLQVKAHKQIAVLTAVSANLMKETEEIDRQRQVVEEQIQSRYETGVRLLEESRHACLLTLKAASQQVKDKVQAEMESTVTLQSSLQAFADDIAAGPHTSASKNKPRPPLLSDAALRHFQHLSDRTEKPAVFSYTWSINTEVVMDSVREFMGSVSVAGVSPESDSSRTDSKERSSAIDTQPLNTAVSCFHATELLALRSDLTQLRQDLMLANDKIKHVTSVNDQLKLDLASANCQFNEDLTSASDKLKHDLTSANDKVKQDIMSVTAVVRETKNDVSNCETDIQRLQQCQTSAASQLTDLREDMCKLNTPVFFNTHLSNNTDFPKGATLVMDKVLANTGGGYDVTTGVFTAPQTATYLFMATTRSYGGKYCLNETDDRAVFQIMVEGKPVASSWCLGGTSCTAHAAVRVDAGQKVWLQAESPLGFSFFNCRALGFGLTSFVGLLTQPEL